MSGKPPLDESREEPHDGLRDESHDEPSDAREERARREESLGELVEGPVASAASRTTSATASARPSGRLRAALLVGSVFLLGGLAGGMVGRALTLRELAAPFKGPPAEVRARFRIEAMRRHLALTPEQTQAIEALLREADPARDAAMKACLPELERLREQTDASIRELLTPEQRRRFDEHERRMREHGPLHGPPPHGPRGRPPPLPPP